ncbi:3-deoxy-7-phosphoheptulonate synthase [Vogesella oryzae]|uniref:3-deoxy-7-phosphoheptulonate synthase n=1 Tax=Vogesella oryzae TaxID=1735285 RepID=UPI001581AAC9|nr:3-deoxy-7-phosphoheptulonate synthase [Vogesella oryzae]
MIIVMAAGATAPQIDAVVGRIRAAGLSEHISRGTERTIIGAVGDERSLSADMFETMPGVERAMRVVKDYRMVSREVKPDNSVVSIRGVPIGGPQLQLIAGPSAIEDAGSLATLAAELHAQGIRLLRAGAYKPRTSPYAFQGIGEAGLEYLQQAARAQGMPMISEILDVRQLDSFLAYDVDAIQVGPRNMQNVPLLRELGSINKPVLLYRGVSATLSEWLMAAEYIAIGGNHNIVFCERGIRSFEPASRHALDITAIPLLKRETHLPVLVDPSHAGGRGWLVPPLAAAAVAAGADGLLLEVHASPQDAWCDAEQAITPAQLQALRAQLQPLAAAVGRSL